MLWSAHVAAYLELLSLHGGGRNLDKGEEILGRFSRWFDPPQIEDYGGRRLMLEETTNAMFARFLAWRRKEPGKAPGTTLSIATLNGDIRYLNPAFDAGLKPNEDHPDRLGTAEDPDWRPPKMKRIREPKRRPRAVSQEVFGRAIEACALATRPQFDGYAREVAIHWWKTNLVLSYLTGIRSGAMLEVPRPTEDDLSRGILRVPAEDDKCDTERAFPLPDLAVEAIRRLPETGDGKLFSWPHCRRYFYTILHRIQRQAGIPTGDHVLPHALRRTKGTEMVKMKCSLPLVQQGLGHASPQTTVQYYIGEISDEQRAAVGALPLPEAFHRGRKREVQRCLF